MPRTLSALNLGPDAQRQVLAQMQAAPAPAEVKRSKYGAKPCTVMGVEFASKLEAGRYLVLLDRQKRGEIMELQVHPRFDFVVNGTPLLMANGQVAHYTADFGFREGGRIIVEEDKGFVVRDWPLRRALFRRCFPHIELREVRK